MKTTGILIVSLGAIVASLGTTLSTESVDWIVFALGMVISVAGVILLRSGEAKLSRAAATPANLQKLKNSLAEVVTLVKALNADKGSYSVYDLPERIDSTLREPLERFIEGRKAIASAYGIQSYANIMNDFAAGERYLNRVWSASVDGYQTEAHTFLNKALDQFTQALSQMEQVMTQSLAQEIAPGMGPNPSPA